MDFKQLLDRAQERLVNFDIKPVLPDLELCNSGALLDVQMKNGCGYYCWLPGFIEELKPKQIVELGGAMGVADIMILQTLPPEDKLYSITLEEHGLEFSFIKEAEKYKNFFPIVGDDLDLSLWPTDLDLLKTDLWFIDTAHEEDQLRAELELYKQYFKPGSIVLFDDMFLNDGMTRVYDDLEKIFPVAEKVRDDKLHWSGFTIVLVGEKND